MNKEQILEAMKQCRDEIRTKQVKDAANRMYNNEMSTTAESVWGVSGFVEGAQWADLHPCGFINEEDYVNRLLERKDITNKEFIEILQQFPEDALISIECCNPCAIMYDEKNNLIRID